MSEHRTAARFLAGLTVSAALVVGFAPSAQAADTGWNGTKSGTVKTSADTGWNGTGTVR